MANQTPDQDNPELGPDAGWDSVDEASWESFPASDPPAVGSSFRIQRSVASHAQPEHPETHAHILADAEQQALREALDDEYRAWATHDQVIRDFGPEPPFIDIRDAKARHIDALRTLFQRYGLPVHENTWSGRVPEYASIQEACEAGIEAEIASTALYDRLMQGTSRADILAVLEELRRASREHHLPALRRCATRG